MPEDILKTLSSNPQNVFSLFPLKSNENENYFNKLTKEFLDPLSKEHSILEQIHIDGLDSTQVFGQAKIVLDNVADQLLFSEIPKYASHKGDDIKVKQYDEVESEDFSESQSDADNISHGEHAENKYDILEEHDESEDFSEAEGSEDEEEDQNEDEEEDENEGEEEKDADVDYLDSDDNTKITKNTKQSNKDQESKDATDNIEGFNNDAFGLNDGFFDIDKFNEQILDMEKEAMADDEEINYFEDLDENDDEGDEIAYYEDFFDRPNERDVSLKQEKDTNKKFDLSDNLRSEDEDEDEEYNHAISLARKDLFDDDMSENDKESQTHTNMSSFEKQQRQIQAEISKLESELVAEKKWTMKGEVSAKSRPHDSLLEDPEAVDLEFDRASKPVPIVTEDFSESIDDVIRRRIKEEQFDDLPKRFISDLEKHDRRPAFELSQEKSKKTLAEIYEEEYNGTDDNTKSEETEKLHSEIGNLFEKVTYMLDSLCSAHYIPKPHQTKTIEITASDAAEINLEDSQPAVVGSGSTLAPQEIYSLKNKGNEKKAANQIQLKSGLSYSKDELSKEERLRLRRAVKRKRSKEHKHKAELKEQLAKEIPEHKRQKRDMMDTLAAAKNVTVIDKKGKKRDLKGNLKKDALAHESSILKL